MRYGFLFFTYTFMMTMFVIYLLNQAFENKRKIKNIENILDAKEE